MGRMVMGGVPESRDAARGAVDAGVLSNADRREYLRLKSEQAERFGVRGLRTQDGLSVVTFGDRLMRCRGRGLRNKVGPIARPVVGDSLVGTLLIQIGSRIDGIFEEWGNKKAVTGGRPATAGINVPGAAVRAYGARRQN